ncbi:hypothetical protein CDL15_Pgr003647 [Punica granatum]|uniref:Uncharacterized protein n=1 Tax=Punica granatum TaxID=22663 RepID=A0A218XST6_PUNGR|nr:hypothetical protein CDL15_Pgr003647 [Punica granatum]
MPGNAEIRWAKLGCFPGLIKLGEGLKPITSPVQIKVRPGLARGPGSGSSQYQVHNTPGPAESWYQAERRPMTDMSIAGPCSVSPV